MKWFCGYLLSLLHEEDPAGPRLQIEANQPVHIDQKMIPNNGRIPEAHSQRMHSLM